MASCPEGQVCDGGEHWAAMALNWSMPSAPPFISSATVHWPFGPSSALASSTISPVAWDGPSWYTATVSPSSSSSGSTTVASGRSSLRGVSSKAGAGSPDTVVVVVAPGAVVVVVPGGAVVLVVPPSWNGAAARLWPSMGAVVVDPPPAVVVVSPAAVVVVDPSPAVVVLASRASGGSWRSTGRNRSSAVAPTRSRARCCWST